MAEAIARRSEVLQQQIDNLQKVAPPALTQAEREQIMRGRKSQADIDTGRKAIADREKAISDHNSKVGDLLGKLDTAIREEGGEASRREREANADPLWNTYIPSAAGAAGGAALGEVGNAMLRKFNKGNAQAVIEIGDELGPVSKMTNSQMNRSIASGAAKTAERYAPSTATGKIASAMGRIGGYAVPAGVVYNEYSKYQQRADDPNRTEADRLSNQAIANGLLGTSTGIALDGGMRMFFPPREPGEGRALTRINAARDFASRMDKSDEARELAQKLRGLRGAGSTGPTIELKAAEAAPSIARPTATPALPAPAEPMDRLKTALQPSEAADPSKAALTRNRDKLITAAKENAGATGKLTKATAAEHLLADGAITDANRGAIAKALGVSNGPNLHSRVLQAVKTMASKPGASVIIPATIGYSVYDALTSPAEAAGPADVAGYAAERLGAGDTLSSVSDAYSDYVKYAQVRGETPIPERAFVRGLADRGIGVGRIAGENRVMAALKPGEYAARAAEPVSRGTAAAAGVGAAGATAGGIEGARRLARGPLGRALARVGGRVLPPIGAAMSAYDLGNMAVEENAKPDSLINGPEQGSMPATPGNPGFMRGQQDAARSAYGQPPEFASTSALQLPEPPAEGQESEFDRLVTASQEDPELAQMLRDAILARVGEAQMEQIPNAMASQAVASRGDPMASMLRNYAQR